MTIGSPVALLARQVGQHQAGDRQHHEGDDEQHEAEQQQRRAIFLGGFAEIVGDQRRDGGAGSSKRRRS
jgi:bacterioferritin (cytochrome b1)